MQFGVTYLETWGGTKLYVAFSHLNFVLVFLFLSELIWHQILIYGISQCLLCLLSNLFSWFMVGACFSCLVVTTPSGEGSLLVWGGFVCRNPLNTPYKPMDYWYSRSEVCIVSPLFEVFVSKVICVIVSVTVTPSRMSYYSDEFVS
jgi:hypothetical protein